MSNPKLGMHFDDCQKRIRRIKSTEKGNKELQGRLVESLKNQADLHQPGAWEELEKMENKDFNNHSQPHLGWSPKYDKRYEEIFNLDIAKPSERLMDEVSG